MILSELYAQLNGSKFSYTTKRLPLFLSIYLCIKTHTLEIQSVCPQKAEGGGEK